MVYLKLSRTENILRKKLSIRELKDDVKKYKYQKKNYPPQRIKIMLPEIDDQVGWLSIRNWILSWILFKISQNNMIILRSVKTSARTNHSFMKKHSHLQKRFWTIKISKRCTLIILNPCWRITKKKDLKWTTFSGRIL